MQNFDLESATAAALETFGCHLYRQRNLNDVNDARCKMHCVSSASVQSLPPTKDALHMHVLRANYQAATHRRSPSQWINAPSPSGRRSDIIDGKGLINWITESCGRHSSQCNTLWLQAFEVREFKLFMQEGKRFLHGYV